MENKKTVTGSWLVEETTRLYDLTIEEGAEITAPQGKFVCMTVNGVGCDPKPGRYHGDILLTVADCYHMAPHALMRINNISRDFQDAVVIDSSKGEVVEAQCVPAIVQGGTVTGEKTEGVYIASSAESFNGVLIYGDGSYTVKDSRVELDGFSANDFMGVGSAVAAIDTADVVIEDCDLTVNGVTRCAVHVGGDSHVTVRNCRIQNTSPDSDWLGDFSWGCGFTRLDLAPGAVVAAPAGRTLTVTLDGQAVDLQPGSYSGTLVLTVD
ncbi:MAG: right-handed parallel beta-helix repeat-containing protein [Oscillospiraceae bacterium]|nr:right-handed parallel beta-helix repeat-containing protein [Oscillospiraceae bacterium]